MSIIKKILLPYFPDNKWLREKWWHRGVLVVSSFIALLSLVLVASGLYFFLQSLYQAYLQFLPSKSDWVPVDIHPLTPMEVINWNILWFDIYVILFGFIFPNLIYRLLLFVLTNNKWKTK